MTQSNKPPSFQSPRVRDRSPPDRLTPLERRLLDDFRNLSYELRENHSNSIVVLQVALEIRRLINAYLIATASRNSR